MQRVFVEKWFPLRHLLVQGLETDKKIILFGEWRIMLYDDGVFNEDALQELNAQIDWPLDLERYPIVHTAVRPPAT
ncbi:hypothetical protein HH1059_20170 [Halorhodospira halochloris]|uniref:Uncharacterized protein n=1 Tax=Halorhodospira halochloris TaxID=1052 RepID=A0A2Z6EZU5_HALHR|nr:hypothetical protein [Halorhodospira halochloris]BBE11146.1 hypothetical protein HH1059_20170 [Halorhodospira halochloris]